MACMSSCYLESSNALPLPCINYFISNSNYEINGILKLKKKNKTSPRDEQTSQLRQKH